MARTHGRRQLRLRRWDYSRPATYSITICTINSADLLGEVVRDEMVPNAIGEIGCGLLAVARKSLRACGARRVDAHAHAHARHPGAVTPAAQKETAVAGKCARLKPLGQVIGAFKTRSTKAVNQLRGTPGARLWQRDYWDRIIHDEYELSRAREYIRTNPANYRPRTYRGGAARERPRDDTVE